MKVTPGDESPPTPRQAVVLDAIRTLTARLGFAPNIKEVAEKAGLSPSRVCQHLDRLKSLGLIAREPGTARSIRVI